MCSKKNIQRRRVAMRCASDRRVFTTLSFDEYAPQVWLGRKNNSSGFAAGQGISLNATSFHPDDESEGRGKPGVRLGVLRNGVPRPWTSGSPMRVDGRYGKLVPATGCVHSAKSCSKVPRGRHSTLPRAAPLQTCARPPDESLLRVPGML